MPETKTIGIIGYYGHSNAGDERMLHSIRREFAGHRLVVTHDFVDAWRRVRELNRCDYVLMGGGSLILPGLNAMTGLLHCIRSPLACIGLGVEVVDDSNRDFVTLLERKATFIYVRDRASAELLTRRENVFVAGDLSFLDPLPIVPEDLFRTTAGTCGVSLTVSGRNMSTWSQPGDLDYCKQMLASHFERLLGIGFSTESGWNDQDVLTDPIAPLPLSATDWGAFYEAYAACGCLVGARFHSLVFAIQTGIPFLSLSYQPKNTRLCADIGKPELDLALKDIRRLESRLAFLTANRESLRDDLLRVRGQVCTDTRSVFDELKARVVA